MDAQRRLLPLLRGTGSPAREDLEAWTARLVAECRERLSIVLPFEPEELEFLALVNDRGEIAPDLLTIEAPMLDRIRSHPALLWKTLNVRRHVGGDGEA